MHPTRVDLLRQEVQGGTYEVPSPELLAEAMIRFGGAQLSTRAEAIALHDMHGLTVREIGKRLGYSYPHVSEMLKDPMRHTFSRS